MSQLVSGEYAAYSDCRICPVSDFTRLLQTCLGQQVVSAGLSVLHQFRVSENLAVWCLAHLFMLRMLHTLDLLR